MPQAVEHGPYEPHDEITPTLLVSVQVSVCVVVPPQTKLQVFEHVPVPHFVEQAPQEPQDKIFPASLVSVHPIVCCTVPPHWFVHVWVQVPEPHVVEQEPAAHPLHETITFASQHGVGLQLLSVSVTEFPHWFMLVLVLVPPPQVFEHELQIPKVVIILGSQEPICASLLKSPSPPPLTAKTL